MLTANELGEKGESRFKEICADAQLICNKSDRDLAGWDFIVEFPLENEAVGAIDKRRKPISCHIQVKTLRESSNRFEMRLSSAEYLAKESKPSFIYIFKVNDQLQFVESFLIHLLDDSLAVILKRLRKEGASSTRVKINKKNISIPVNKNSVRLEPTGEELRKALIQACGSDLGAYISKKNNQLENMGFEGRPYEMKGTFHLGDVEEIVDAFLGIKKDIRISNLQTFETRFGIKLPDKTLGETAIANISPSPADHCSISIRRSILDLPVVFEGEIFVPAIPNLPKDKFKALVKSSFFTFEFKPNRKKTQITSNVDLSAKHTLQEWLGFWQATKIFAEGAGVIQIAPKAIGSAMEIPISCSIAEPSVKTCDSWIGLCEKTSVLLRMAGISYEPQLSMSELAEKDVQVLLISAILSGTNPLKKFITKQNAQISALNQIEMVCADFVKIGEAVIAYYGVSKFALEHENSQVIWEPINFELKALRDVSNFPNQYEEFLDAAKKVTGIQNIISRSVR